MMAKLKRSGGSRSANSVARMGIRFLWTVLLVGFVAEVVAVKPSYGGEDRTVSVVAQSRGFARAGDGVVAIGHGRVLDEISTFRYRPLAPRNDRVDPLDNFHRYRNGYDVKSKHYWASAVFTGISGYAIAAGWLVLGLLLLLFACCNCLCGSREHSKRPRSRAFFWTPRIIVFLLSAVAVGSGVVLLIASRRLNSQVNNVENVLLEAAQNATDTIYNVSSTLNSVKGVVQPYSQDLYTSLDSTQIKLDSLAVVINEKAFVKYKKKYHMVFRIVDIVLIVVTSVGLLLIALGFASTFLRWRRVFYLIIFVTWVFTALTWFLYGFFFSVHYVAEDSCLAFKEYLQDPQNTTLDNLIPCADLASSSSQYLQVRVAMKSIIETATDEFLYYTNGSTSLTGVCDPIGPPPTYNYTGICPNDTLPIGELSNLLQPFVCNDTRNACLQMYPFYVNQSLYDGVAAISSASQSTLDAFPKMEELTNCSLILNPIDTIVHERCGPAKVAINRIWICFAVMSSILVLLIVFWCLANRRNTQQRYNTSITPQEQPFTGARASYTVMPK